MDLFRLKFKTLATAGASKGYLHYFQFVWLWQSLWRVLNWYLRGLQFTKCDALWVTGVQTSNRFYEQFSNCPAIDTRWTHRECLACKKISKNGIFYIFQFAWPWLLCTKWKTECLKVVGFENFELGSNKFYLSILQLTLVNLDWLNDWHQSEP